jgi:hypothetical protein
MEHANRGFLERPLPTFRTTPKQNQNEFRFRSTKCGMWVLVWDREQIVMLHPPDNRLASIFRFQRDLPHDDPIPAGRAVDNGAIIERTNYVEWVFIKG